MYKSNNFSWRKGNPYLSQDEWESRQESIREEIAQAEEGERDLNENCRVSWVSPVSGKEIEVFIWSRESIWIKVDGRMQAQLERSECQFRPVPEKQLAQARANGIIAKLGPLGVTAEQKAKIEEKIERMR